MTRIGLFLTGIGIAILVVLVNGCGGGKYQPSAHPQTDNAVSLAASNWEIRYSTGMPDHPKDAGSGWFFDFLQAPRTINYIQVPYHQTVSHSSVTVTYRIDAQSPEYYQAGLEDINPATVNLFLERSDDDLTDPAKEYYRWWPPANTLPTSSGTYTVTVPLTFDHWGSVFGKTDPVNFQATLDELGFVGLTFGGQYFRGHGVGLSSGSSRFTLISYSIN